jgi:hypothetical protein
MFHTFYWLVTVVMVLRIAKGRRGGWERAEVGYLVEVRISNATTCVCTQENNYITSVSHHCRKNLHKPGGLRTRVDDF